MFLIIEFFPYIWRFLKRWGWTAPAAVTLMIVFACESSPTYSCSLSSRLSDVAIPAAVTVALFFVNLWYRRTHYDLPEYVLNAQRGRALAVAAAAAEAASSPSRYSEVPAGARLKSCPECSSQVGSLSTKCRHCGYLFE